MPAGDAKLLAHIRKEAAKKQRRKGAGGSQGGSEVREWRGGGGGRREEGGGGGRREEEEGGGRMRSWSGMSGPVGRSRVEQGDGGRTGLSRSSLYTVRAPNPPKTPTRLPSLLLPII